MMKDKELLEMADACLDKYNFHRARFITTGNVDDFRAAVAYKSDRELLLAELEKEL